MSIFTPRLQWTLAFLFSIWTYHISTANVETDNAFGIYCPDDRWADCTDELWNLDIYGRAYVQDYSGIRYLSNPQVTHHLNSCNVGYITRTWKAYDYHGQLHTCSQTIHLGSSTGGLNASQIEWPKQGLILEGCNPSLNPDHLPYGYGRPWIWGQGTCSNIGVTYSDETFHFGAGCKKIIRRWTVIDWCTYQPNYGTNGLYRYDQVIKINNTYEPVVTVPKDITVSSYDCDSAYVNLEELTTEYGKCGDSYQITNNSNYADEEGGDASGTYPVGAHWVRFTVEYGCGLYKHYTVEVIVENKSSPVPYCITNLSTALMGVDTDGDGVFDDGMVEIWAKDFNKDSYHPCGYGNLKFSFSSDVTDTYRTFDCRHVGVNELEMWVTDSRGNQNYCHITVNVGNHNANIPNCGDPEPPEPIITGQINSLFGDIMQDIDLTLTGMELDTVVNTSYDTTTQEVIVDSFINASGATIYVWGTEEVITENQETVITTMTMEEVSDVLGTYTFFDVPLHKDYMVTANYNHYNTENVNNVDAMMLYDHIFGFEEITNPYVMIAADIDNNGEVDKNDLRMLLEFLMGLKPELNTEKSWELVDASHHFDNAKTVLSELSMNYKELYNIQELTRVDFMAIQKGNLTNQNLAWRTNSLEYMWNKLNSITTGSVHIAPNPFGEKSIIQLDTDSYTDALLTITDISGRIVYRQQSIDKKDHNWSISEENISASGIYFYTIDLGDKVYNGKLVKQ